MRCHEITQKGYQMESKQKLIQLYDSGRFECDVWFHENLTKVAEEMELFENLPKVKENCANVQRIHDLTESNSNSLSEQFDEEKVAENLVIIKGLIDKTEKKSTDDVMRKCQSLNFINYSHHIAQIIAKYNFHPNYKQIVERIYKSVHDRRLRLDNLFVCLLFMYKNKQKVEEVMGLYNKALQKSLLILKEYREKMKFIKDNFQELKSQPKVVAYCFGVYHILTVSLKLGELVRVLDGKSTFMLKLPTFKHEVHEVLSLWPQVGQKTRQIELRNTEDLPIAELKDWICGEQEKISAVKNTCRICLRKLSQGELTCQEKSDHHAVCAQVLKQLLMG